MIIYRCASPAALASCAAVRHVQDCDSRPPVLALCPGLPGRRLSARRRRPCQTTAVCRHLNTCCQSDVQQFRRQDICRRRTTSLEQSAAQSQTVWAVIRPVQAVTGWCTNPYHVVSQCSLMPGCRIGLRRSAPTYGKR